jgi:hypothetical protein
MNARQTVASDANDVPAGFVAMASYGSRPSGGRGSDEYEWILDAYQSGEIEAVKVMRNPRHKSGPVFVNAAQARLLIERKRLASSQPASAEDAAAWPQALAALVRIADSLDAIRAALPAAAGREWETA